MRPTNLVPAAALAVVTGLGAFAQSAHAQVVTLQDANASAQINPDSSAGNFNWSVNGNNYLAQQWFWIRAGADTAERPISSLTKTIQNATDTNPGSDLRADSLNLRYNESRYYVDTTFTLRGGPGSQISSDMSESLIIHNLSAAPLTFSFFQYVNFDLGGAPGDIAQILAGRIATQSNNGFLVTETVTSPAPSQYAVALFPTILNSLNDAGLTNLGAVAGPIGPGDATWAFQWDFTLLSGQEFIISKDKHLVPAPGAAVLLGLGGLIAGRRRRMA